MVKPAFFRVYAAIFCSIDLETTTIVNGAYGDYPKITATLYHGVDLLFYRPGSGDLLVLPKLYRFC